MPKLLSVSQQPTSFSPGIMRLRPESVRSKFLVVFSGVFPNKKAVFRMFRG